MQFLHVSWSADQQCAQHICGGSRAQVAGSSAGARGLLLCCSHRGPAQPHAAHKASREILSPAAPPTLPRLYLRESNLLRPEWIESEAPLAQSENSRAVGVMSY